VSLVNDVSHVRFADLTWSNWAALHEIATAFSWTAAFNFNAGTNVLVFSLGTPNSTEALMLVRVGHVSRCDAGHRDPSIYVGFLEVAPWNRASSQERRFSGIGPVMLRTACDLSFQRGYDGRVGLHSLKAAEEFYRRLGFRGLDCPNEYNELYMELDVAASRQFLGA
jgi:hypothetical protein